MHRTLPGMLLAAWSVVAAAQCTNYTINVGGGGFDAEIDWELVNELGTVVSSGIAPTTVPACLPPGCYTMYLYDLFGDGWNGATFSIRVQPSNTVVSGGTLNNGAFGTAQVNLGGGCGGGNCANYTLTVTGGAYPEEISWNIVSGVLVVATGYALSTQVLCLDTGCFVMHLFDAFGDGWNGAAWTLSNSGGSTVGTGSLPTGSIGQQVIDLSPTTSCSIAGPVVASDCGQAESICTDYSWAIDPNGHGALNEIPPLGSLGNPDLMPMDFVNSAWGTDHWGCLRSNEVNSTWMIIDVYGSGALEFTFGGLGSQTGFYDWIMYPYHVNTCSQVMANQVPPVRCNWNGVAYGGTGLAEVLPPGGDPMNYEPPMNVLAGQQYLICFSNWSSVTTFVPLEFTGAATVSCTPIILPLELLAFTAEQEGAIVRLRWTTATERNTDRFVVERRHGTGEWEDIGELPASGGSLQAVHYDFTDPAPLTGHDYYRLRMVDRDGSFTWSPTVHALFRPVGPLVFPNPSTGTFWVRSAGGTLELLDATGRAVEHQVLCRNDEVREMLVPAGVSGVFTVLISEGEKRHAERVVLR